MPNPKRTTRPIKSPVPPKLTVADQTLVDAAHALARGRSRDNTDGERSMKKAVQAFNALTGSDMTEEEGNQFMICLKLARAQTSNNPDNYVDIAGYAGLGNEAAQG